MTNTVSVLKGIPNYCGTTSMILMNPNHASLSVVGDRVTLNTSTYVALTTITLTYQLDNYPLETDTITFDISVVDCANSDLTFVAALTDMAAILGSAMIQQTISVTNSVSQLTLDPTSCGDYTYTLVGPHSASLTQNIADSSILELDTTSQVSTETVQVEVSLQSHTSVSTSDTFEITVSQDTDCTATVLTINPLNLMSV